MDTDIQETPGETIEEKKKKKKLTIREQLFIKEYIRTGDSTQSAKVAYNTTSDNSASSIGSQLLRKLNYQDLMERMGLSDRLLLSKLQEGLNADKVVNIDKQGKKTVHPDYQSQHRYLDTALKLKKRLNQQEDNTSNTLIGLSIVVQAKD